MTDEGERGERGRKKEMMHGVYEGMFVVGRGVGGLAAKGETEWLTWWEREGGRADLGKTGGCMGKDFVDMDMDMNTE